MRDIRRRIPINYFVPALALLVGALLCWQAWRYAGLVGRFAEWQFNDVDSYFPVLTIMALAMLAALPLLLIILIGRYIGNRRLEALVEVSALTQIDRAIATLLALTYVMYTFCGLAIVGMLGLWGASLLRGVDKHAPVNVVVGGPGVVFDGNTRLTGQIDRRNVGRLTQSLFFTSRTLFLAPVYPVGGRQEPVRYFVELTPEDGIRTAVQPVIGILQHAAFPRELITLFGEKAIAVDPQASVLFATDRSRQWPYMVAILQCLGFALLALVFARLFRWQRNTMIEERAALSPPA